MTKKHARVGAVVLAAALGGLLLAWPSQPSYQGRSITKWFYRDGHYVAPADPNKDVEAFRAMGREAVPFLVAKLERVPSEEVKGLLSVVSRNAREAYRQRGQMWQSRAAYLLGEIGPIARSAEPNLTIAAASSDWALRGAATVALAKIRQQPSDPLIDQLKDTSDAQAWYENAMMVGQLGSRAERAIPILLEALNHTNNVIQAHALIALGMIARQPDKCVPAIMPFLNSPSVGHRQKAIGALLDFGTNAVVAKKAIQGLLSDPDPWVRKEAARAMKVFGTLGPSDYGGTQSPSGASLLL